MLGPPTPAIEFRRSPSPGTPSCTGTQDPTPSPTEPGLSVTAYFSLHPSTLIQYAPLVPLSHSAVALYSRPPCGRRFIRGYGIRGTADPKCGGSTWCAHPASTCLCKTLPRTLARATSLSAKEDARARAMSCGYDLRGRLLHLTGPHDHRVLLVHRGLRADVKQARVRILDAVEVGGAGEGVRSKVREE
jgi:hypothetical protein